MAAARTACPARWTATNWRNRFARLLTGLALAPALALSSPAFAQDRNADKAAVFKTVKDGKFIFLTTVKP